MVVRLEMNVLFKGFHALSSESCFPVIFAKFSRGVLDSSGGFPRPPEGRQMISNMPIWVDSPVGDLHPQKLTWNLKIDGFQ